MTTFEKVRTIIADELSVNESDVILDASIVEDLGADSLDMVEMVMRFEAEFSVDISDRSVEAVKTVRDIVELVEKLAAG